MLQEDGHACLQLPPFDSNIYPAILDPDQNIRIPINSNNKFQAIPRPDLTDDRFTLPKSNYNTKPPTSEILYQPNIENFTPSNANGGYTMSEGDYTRERKKW